MMQDYDSYISYIIDSWKEYTPFIFNRCHYSEFNPECNKHIFVYSTTRYGNLVVGKVQHAKFFTLTEILNKGYTTPIGIVFELNKEKDITVRYSKHAISASTKEINPQNAESLIRQEQYTTYYLDVLSIGNEAEIASDLRTIMGVSL